MNRLSSGYSSLMDWLKCTRIKPDLSWVFKIGIVASIFLSLMGCNTRIIAQTPTATPRSTETQSRSIATITPVPQPSPTPFNYKIVKDDTLLGIAFKHGLTLDELLAANPGIDPNFLTIGMTITLPIGDQAVRRPLLPCL